MASATPWTEARIERALHLWKSGSSASEIARAIGGVTRNAVIGKLTRIGAPARSTMAQRVVVAIKARRGAERQWTKAEAELITRLYCDEGRDTEFIARRLGVSRQAVTAKLMLLGIGMRRAKSPKAAGAVTTTAPAAKLDAVARGAAALASSVWTGQRDPVSLMDLEAHSCRWPIDVPGGVGFCGAPKERGSYCAPHAQAGSSTLANGERPNAKVYERAMRRFA